MTAEIVVDLGHFSCHPLCAVLRNSPCSRSPRQTEPELPIIHQLDQVPGGALLC